MDSETTPTEQTNPAQLKIKVKTLDNNIFPLEVKPDVRLSSKLYKLNLF